MREHAMIDLLTDVFAAGPFIPHGHSHMATAYFTPVGS
jgi:hypothetical protein